MSDFFRSHPDGAFNQSWYDDPGPTGNIGEHRLCIGRYWPVMIKNSCDSFKDNLFNERFLISQFHDINSRMLRSPATGIWIEIWSENLRNLKTKNPVTMAVKFIITITKLCKEILKIFIISTFIFSSVLYHS